MSQCKNCNNSLKSSDKFCPNCGQKNRERLSLKLMLGELANAYLSWDSKLFRTLIPLFTKPGFVSKDYLAGKRLHYVAPLRMYLFASVMFFILISLFGTRVSPESADTEGQIFNLNFDGDTMGLTRDSLLLLAEHNQLNELEEIKNHEDGFFKTFMIQSLKVSLQTGGFLQYLQKNISFMFFLFIPVFGWILKLFHRKKRMDYIEHLVYGLYFHAFVFITLFITVAFGHIIGMGWPVFVGVPSLIIYLCLGLKYFYEGKWGMTILKTFFILLVYLVLFVIFATCTIGLTIWFY
jgi:hypothetical protein